MRLIKVEPESLPGTTFPYLKEGNWIANPITSRIRSLGTLNRYDWVWIGFNGEVNVTLGRIYSERVGSLLFVVILTVVPRVYKAFWLSLMADLVVVKASITDEQEARDHKKAICFSLCPRINSKWNLSNQSISPSWITFMPVFAIAGQAPWIPHQEHLMLWTVRLSHIESSKDGIGMAHCNSAWVIICIISVSRCACTH